MSSQCPFQSTVRTQRHIPTGSDPSLSLLNSEAILLANSLTSVTQAQEKLDNTPGIDNLAFIHSSAEEADFGDNSLDVILCHNGVWYFQDHLRVVQNCKRWLRPSGGRFCYNVFEVRHSAGPFYLSRPPDPGCWPA